MKHYIIETHYGAVQVKTGKAFKLKTDKRTKEGKLRQQIFQAIEALSEAAWMLDCDISDISPVDHDLLRRFKPLI